MRVALLGMPNRRGLRVLRDLLEQPEVASVVLVGPREPELTQPLDDSDLQRRRVDVAPGPLTVKGIADALTGADVALGCLQGPEQELAALQAAQETNTPYISACEDHETIEALFRRGSNRGSSRGSSSGSSRGSSSGAIAVPNMSWTPGISNLLVRAAAARFDNVQAVHVAWSVSGSEDGVDGLERLLAARLSKAQVLEGGQRRTRHPGTGTHRVFFPEPVAWKRVSLVRGAEVLTIPELLPGLDEMAVEGCTDGGSMATRARLAARTRSVAAGFAPPARGAGWSALRVDVTGRSGGATRVETLGVVDRLANLQSVPLLVAGIMAGSGEVQASGIAAPEAAFDPERFFQRLSQQGIRAAHLER